MIVYYRQRKQFLIVVLIVVLTVAPKILDELATEGSMYTDVYLDRYMLIPYGRFV